MKSQNDLENIKIPDWFSDDFSRFLSETGNVIRNIFIRCCQAKIRILENDYRQTDCPLFVWEALSFCLENNISPPDYVKEYIQSCHNALFDKYYDDDGVRYQEICEGLGLKDKGFIRVYSSRKEQRLYVVAYYSYLILYAVSNQSNATSGRVKKQIRSEVADGMMLSANTDKSYRNWINNFSVTEEDFFSFFVEEDNQLKATFPDIPWNIPIVINENIDLFHQIVSQ